MADLALGYTKTALDFVVNQVQTAIKEEEEQWQTVQRDLVFITGEFEMMQSFLDTADRERLKSLVVRTWVQQVRDLSYDVEDCIDLVLQLDSRKRPWWLRLLPSWMKAAPEAPVDEAVAEIALLKARVVDVSTRNMRYNLVTDSGAKPGVPRVLGGSNINTNDVLDLNKCFDFDEKSLDKCLISDVMSLQVICVLSETGGDLGTLCSIRRRYEDIFFDTESRRAWVKLVHPFNPHDFIRSLLVQFLSSSCQAEGEKILGVEVLTKMEEIQLVNKFVVEVNMCKYFIVLEGVSSMEEWDAIRTYLPDRMNASRIIVLTQHVEIATLCIGEPYQLFVSRQSSTHHPSYIYYRGDSGEVARDGVPGKEGPWPDRRNREAEELFSELKKTYTNLILVCGPSNVGKTALVRAVYKHVQTRLDRSAGGFARQAWADVPHPLDTNDLAHDILSKLTNDTWIRGDLVTTCQFVLEHSPGRDLVVFDGVRSNEDWDQITADITCTIKPGSCVIVITNDESVAAHIAGERERYVDFVLRVDPLQEDLKVNEEQAAVAAELHGRREEADELLNLVMDTNSSHLVVWGPQGVGKTALVRAVYNRVRGLNGGFKHQAWVNVPHPLVDVAGVARDIISGLRNRRDRAFEGSEVAGCQTMLRCVRGRTMVVLDGVRSKEDWDRIDAVITKAMQPGSCVVVITSDALAAHYVRRSEGHVRRVNRLGAASAFRLFLQEARISKKKGNDVLEQCGSLSSKCGGLPKFIVTIAEYLLEFDGERRMTEMRLLDDNFIHQLQHKPEFDCLKDVLVWLYSKFDGSSQLLKKCIFYLPIFSRDSNIRGKRLVRRWIAEGYCNGTNSKEEAEDLIGKVADLCLFQPWETVIPVPSAMSKTSCQVNYSFLDYIISRHTEEKTLLPLEISVLDGSCSPPTNRVGQHLAIRSGWGRDEAAYISLDCSRLRSLTASGEWKPFFIPRKMRVLRVLDLEGTFNLKDGGLDKIGELMPHLKFLSLRRCTPISRLPESLGVLLRLETLDIRHTSITELPKNITKLQKLQHIRAGTTQWDSSGPDVPVAVAAPIPPSSAETPTELATPSQQDKRRARQSRGSTLSACLCKSLGSTLSVCLCKSFGGSVAGYRTGGVGVPRGMGGMKALHTLGVVDVNMPGGKALLADLSKMKEEEKNKNKKGAESHPLRNLSLCGIDWSRHLLHCISSQDQLESLSLRAEILQVEHFNLPPNIVKFRLDVEGLLHQGAVDAIKHHRNLQTLRLQAKEVQGGTVCFFATTKAGESDGGSFSEIKILEISCRSSVHVMFSHQGMQKLELLKVHYHSGAPLEISGLDQLGALKQVWLIGSCDDTLKEALKKQLSGHRNKPALYMEEQGFLVNVMEEQGYVKEEQDDYENVEEEQDDSENVEEEQDDYENVEEEQDDYENVEEEQDDSENVEEEQGLIENVVEEQGSS